MEDTPNSGTGQNVQTRVEKELKSRPELVQIQLQQMAVKNVLGHQEEPGTAKHIMAAQVCNI